MSRRGYWIVRCGVNLVVMGLALAFNYHPVFLVRIPIWTVCIVFFLWATFQRLENLGFSKWWAVGLFIPVVHLVIGAGLLAGPENYASRDDTDDLGALLLVPSIFALGGELFVIAMELSSATESLYHWSS